MSAARRDTGEQGAAVTRVVLGLLIVAFGGILLAGNLDLIESRPALRLFWPLAFVAIGGSVLAAGRGAGRWWGLLWILAGAWIWAEQREWIAVDWFDVFLPAALVFAGLQLLRRALRGPRSRAGGGAGATESVVHGFAVMSGNVVRSATPEFRGAELSAFMGGVTLDLREAKMAAAEAEIDLFAMWGGIEIKVPPGWVVESHVTPLLAGFEDKTQPVAGAATGRLVVRGTVVMGGVEIRS